MTSPCSVIRNRPPTVPGAARESRGGRPSTATDRVHRDREKSARPRRFGAASRRARAARGIGPSRLQEAALFVAVGVANHDLLHVAPKFHVPSIDRQTQQAIDDRRSLIQWFQRLEQRDDNYRLTLISG